MKNNDFNLRTPLTNVLKSIGYNEPIDENNPGDIQRVVDYIRRKYDIVVYDAIAPFVDPTSSKPKILFRKKVKYCSLRDGWNGRVSVGESGLIPDPNAATVECIFVAVKYINDNKLKGRTHE